MFDLFILQQYLLRKAEKAPKATNKFERKTDSSARWFRARAPFYASVFLSTMALIQSVREKFDKCPYSESDVFKVGDDGILEPCSDCVVHGNGGKLSKNQLH